jgi:hypothetical protein
MSTHSAHPLREPWNPGKHYPPLVPVDDQGRPINDDKQITNDHSPLTPHNSPTPDHSPIRNRIKGHRRIRAADLVPYEWNFRLHPDGQKAALEAIYREVGFARSLLAYELPDGRLKLIDGHLRRDLDPNMEVDVEILDVTDAEARALLLSIDPLAALAQTQEQLHHRLMALTPTDTAELRLAWEAAARAAVDERPAASLPKDVGEYPGLFMVLVTCRDEQHQVELLERFGREGLECKALLT